MLGCITHSNRYQVEPPDGTAPNLPQHVARLTSEHTSIDGREFRLTLSAFGSRLTYLKITNLTCSDFDWPYPEGKSSEKSPSLVHAFITLTDQMIPGASKIFHLCPVLETLVVGADLLTSTLLFSDEDAEDVLAVTFTHPLKHLYIASPARSGSFIEEELLTTEEIAGAIDDGALPELQTVTLEVFFNVPKEWRSSDLLLHRKLKKRAGEGVEDSQSRGVRFAVLQPS